MAIGSNGHSSKTKWQTWEQNFLKWFVKGNFETDARMIVQDLLEPEITNEFFSR